MLAGGVRADQSRPGFEEPEKVLAGLEIADGEDVGPRDGESLEHRRDVGRGERPKAGLDPFGDHGDPFRGDAGQGEHVGPGVARGHDDALGVAGGPAHAGIQHGAIAGAEPGGVADEGEVVDGHDPGAIGGGRSGVGRVDDLGVEATGERRQLGQEAAQVRGAA